MIYSEPKTETNRRDMMRRGKVCVFPCKTSFRPVNQKYHRKHSGFSLSLSSDWFLGTLVASFSWVNELQRCAHMQKNIYTSGFVLNLWPTHFIYLGLVCIPKLRLQLSKWRRRKVRNNSIPEEQQLYLHCHSLHKSFKNPVSTIYFLVLREQFTHTTSNENNNLYFLIVASEKKIFCKDIFAKAVSFS